MQLTSSSGSQHTNAEMKASTSQNNTLAASLSLLADGAHAHGNGPRGTFCGGTLGTTTLS